MADLSPPTASRAPRWAVLTAWAAGLVLLVLHLDFWRPQRTVLYFGWMPEELLYRIGWMFLAWLFLMFFCSYVWTDEG